MNLIDFFTHHPNVVVAFSGGIDSAFLLYIAKKYTHNTHAIYIKTAFQPAFELRDACDFCKSYEIPLNVVELDIYNHTEILANPVDRCYHCKRVIFERICKEASAYPHDVILDGTNADDDENDRPGMRALKELNILSPLRLCGMTKTMIREAAKDAGISLWNKPSYACLATRIPHGECITKEKLERTEIAENYLMDMGFKDIRVRCIGNTAKIQISASDFLSFVENRRRILDVLQKYYSSVTLDLKARDE